MSAVDVLAVMAKACRECAGRDFRDLEEARAAVAELQKRYELLLRGQTHAIEMLRGQRRKRADEINAMAEELEPAAAALARCKGESA